MNISNKKLYSEILTFCEENGYLKELQKSLKDSEQKRFNQKEILKFGLDILDAIHCVVDKKRTFLFLNEIKQNTKEGSHTLETGIGTGILSFFASMHGSVVTGLEINKNVLHLANTIKRDLLQKAVLTKKVPTFLKRNAITFNSKERFDLIICENIYTGMFYEKQIQIMNNVRKFLNKNGVAIPAKMQNYIQLCHIETPNNIEPGTLFIPAIDKKDLIKIKKLSKKKLYDEIDFLKKNKNRCSYIGNISIEKDGYVNGLLITTDIVMPSGKIIKGSDTIFFNNDIILAIKGKNGFKKQEKALVKITYPYGSKPQDARVLIS